MVTMQEKVLKTQLSSDSSQINRKNSLKILVVEDNFLIQRVIKEMLEILGCEADFAEDGKTALALYCSDYALILMDIELPDFTGLEVTKIIRKIEKQQQCSRTPIIAITSHHDEPEYQEKCLKAGMNGCSGKPSLAQLKQWISEHVAVQQTH